MTVGGMAPSCWKVDSQSRAEGFGGPVKAGWSALENIDLENVRDIVDRSQGGLLGLKRRSRLFPYSCLCLTKTQSLGPACMNRETSGAARILLRPFNTNRNAPPFKPRP